MEARDWARKFVTTHVSRPRSALAAADSAMPTPRISIIRYEAVPKTGSPPRLSKQFYFLLPLV